MGVFEGGGFGISSPLIVLPSLRVFFASAIAEVKNVSRSAMEFQLLKDLETFFLVAPAPLKNTTIDVFYNSYILDPSLIAFHKTVCSFFASPKKRTKKSLG